MYNILSNIKLCNIYFIIESLKGKRVIITGASAGIGEQLAYQFAHFGAHVFVTSRRESVLKEVSLFVANNIIVVK